MSNDNEEKKQTKTDENRSSDRRGGGGGGQRHSRGGGGGGGGNFRRPRRGGPGGRGGKRRGKMNSYCPKGTCFNYKDIDTLQRYVTETGKIKPRRQTGNCSRCQRELAREVKRARHLALLPFVISND